METFDFLLTSGIAVFVAVVLLLLLSLFYSDQKIIVGIVFNATEKKLTVRVRALSDQFVNDVAIPYSDLKVVNERLSDGMSNIMFDAITILRRNEVVGHYYKNHDMWESQGQIESEIFKIRK